MKKTIAIATLILATITATAKANTSENQVDLDNIYPLSTQVIELETETDSVIVEDGNGNLWAFYGIEDWMVGDRCSLIMDKAGTESIYDDVILKAKYDGR